jgi:hypothetical protein
LNNDTGNQWMTLADIAGDLFIPLGSVYAMRAKGTGPTGYKIGKHVRVRRRDYEAWLSTRMERGA